MAEELLLLRSQAAGTVADADGADGEVWCMDDTGGDQMAGEEWRETINGWMKASEPLHTTVPKAHEGHTC